MKVASARAQIAVSRPHHTSLLSSSNGIGLAVPRRRAIFCRPAAPAGDHTSSASLTDVTNLPSAQGETPVTPFVVSDTAFNPAQQTLQGLLDKDANVHFQEAYSGTGGLPGIVTVPATLSTSSQAVGVPTANTFDELSRGKIAGLTDSDNLDATEKANIQVRMHTAENLVNSSVAAQHVTESGDRAITAASLNGLEKLTQLSVPTHHLADNGEKVDIQLSLHAKEKMTRPSIPAQHQHVPHTRTAPRPAKMIPPPVISDDMLGPDQATVGSWKWNVANAKKLLAFMLPAATVPMADPLQTMIDTVCIGQFGTAAALASLGPANVVFGFTQYLFASLQTAALSIISARLSQGDNKTAQSVFSSALCLAVTFGTVSLLVFEQLAPTLIGLTGVDASLIPLCADYLRIRALAQPAVLLNMVLNSCLLAQRNVSAPMKSVFLTSFISLVGNLVFVGMMGWGVSGAAITTVASQYIGCMILATAAAKSGKLRPLPKIPSLSELKMILSTLGPLSIVYTCKNVSYMLVYTTATSMNTLSLAAHQALLALWNMCAFTTTPFESAALTFYPNTASNMQKNSFTRLLLVMGLFNGLAIGMVGAAVALCGPSMLTSESLLWPLISSVWIQLPATLCLVGVDMAAAGLLFARGDFNYLAQSYSLTLVLLAGYLFTFCQPGVGLTGIWSALVFFQFVRAVQSAGRLVLTGGVELPFWNRKGAYAA